MWNAARVAVVAALVCLLPLMGLPVEAATYIWDSNPTSVGAQDGAGTWTLAGTTWWNPSATNNVALSTTDVAQFGAGGVGGTVTLSGDQTLAGMIFAQTATSGYSFTGESPTTLTLGASGITILPGAQPVAIGDANLSLLLGANQTWLNRSTGVLTVGGTIATDGHTLTLAGMNGVTGSGLYAVNAGISGGGGLTVTNLASATLTAVGGYTGATRLEAGGTLTLSGAAGALPTTSSITLQNGSLAIVNDVGQQGVDRVGNSIGITSYGGTISWTNPSGDNTSNWAETLGTLSLLAGQTNIVSTNAVNAARQQVLTLGAGSLTHAAGNTSTIAFAGASLGTGTTNNVAITSLADTATGQIIAPWATYGSTAAAQTDYASYNRNAGTSNLRGIQAAGIAATTEPNWTTAANSYTMNATATLTATRTITALRHTAGSVTLGLGASTFSLATYGILNGGTGTLTVATTGTGAVTTPTGGDNTLFLIAGNNAITFSTALIANNGNPVNVVKAGSAIVTFTGNHTYTGVTTINSGILSSASTSGISFNGGAPSWLGASSSAAANLVINGGTLRYSGATGGTTDRLFTVGEAGATLQNAAASNGTLVYTATGSLVMAGSGNRTLTLINGGTGGFTFTPVIVDPAVGRTTLVTSAGGTGNIIFDPAAANTFTGGIVIQDRNFDARSAAALGSNVVTFGSGTTPALLLRNNTATDFSGLGASLNVGNTNGTLTFGRTSAGNNITHQFGAISLGTALLTLTQINLNTNNGASLTLGQLVLTGNGALALNNGSGSAVPLVTVGTFSDGGIARTLTVSGGAGNAGSGPRLVFAGAATTFSQGTTLVIDNGTNSAVRITHSNGFSNGNAADAVLSFGSGGTGTLQLLNDVNTVFNNSILFGNNNGTITVGGVSSQSAKSYTAGPLSIGTAVFTLTQANASSNNAHSLVLGETTLTGNPTLTLNNTNGSGVGSLTLGALDDGGVARTIVKNGAATLQLSGAATSMIAATTLTALTGIVQVNNGNALGNSTLILGDGTTSGRLIVANGVNLGATSTVTYSGGFSLIASATIAGPASGTGTISAAININAPVAADTGHLLGGGGTLSILGPIVAGGTSNGEVIIRSGNVSLGNSTGNSYSSLRINAGATTIAIDNAVPTTTNVALAELAAASINISAGITQTIGASATWTLGGSGPTLENNVGTIATGTGTLLLNGTLANNTGSLATQLVTGAVSFGGGSGTFDIDSGHATSDMTVSASVANGSLIKEGAGILRLTGSKTLTGLTINEGAVVGGYGTSGVQNITIGAAGSLQLINSLAETLTLAGDPAALNVAGGARIGLELGAPGVSDLLAVGLGGTATTSGTITLDFYNLGGLAAGTYTLLSAPSGLTTGGTTYSVGSAPLGFNYSINATDTLVQLTTTAYTPRFWRDSQATGSWSTVNAGPLTNWATDAAGAVNSTDVPTTNHTVIFSATSAVGPVISTTLDGPFTIDALQFLAAPTGVTAVNIAAGTGGTLTLAPATSSAGIFVDTNAGTATLAAGLPLTIGAAQTWNVVGGGTNGSALVVAADVNFNAGSVTKSGAGAMTLSGTNTSGGTLTLSAGTLNLNGAAVLGAANFTINGGTTLNNTGGGPVVIGTTNNISLNGNFTFTGTQNLSFAANPVLLPTNVTITTTAGVLTFNGNMSESGTRSLTKLGAGALTLGGNNSFSGGVNLGAGILNINHAGALGTGTFRVTAGTIDNTSGAPVTVTGNAQTWNGNFTFAGTNNLNLGTGAVSLGSGAGTSRTITVAAGILEVAGDISNGPVGTGITKSGPGTLTLSGDSTYTGNTVLGAGTLNVTGSLTGNMTATTLTTGTVAGTTTLNIAGDITMFNIAGANLLNSVTVWNQTSGNVLVTPGTGNNNFLASVSGSYGYFNFTGGTYKNTGRFVVANAAGSSAVLRVSGNAVFDHTGGEYFMITQGGPAGEVTLLTGGTINHGGSTQDFHINLNQSNVLGVLNVAGGTLNVGNLGVQFGNSTSTVITNNNGIVNLASGTLSMGAGFLLSYGGTGTVANVYLNFAGGTLRANAAMATVIPASLASNPQVTVVSNLFGSVDNTAAGGPTFDGGLVFDTNGLASTIGQVLAGAAGVGVQQADVSITGGSGYAGPPVLQFSTTGVVAGGTPASGYALISGGQVTGIVITSPGTYTAGTTPTVTLVGGGGTGAAVTLAALNTANVSGGLTVSGAGTLTLGAANTYSGVTRVVGAGTILNTTFAIGDIGVAGGFGTGNATNDATNAASIVLDGGILRSSVAAPTATNRLFTVTQNGGQLESNHGTAANILTFGAVGKSVAFTGSGPRTFSLGGANTGDNVFSLNLNDGTGGATTLGKVGAGKWILNGTANTFTGGTNIAAGILAFDAGRLGPSGTITFTGNSTLLWNGANTDDLSGRLVLANAVVGTLDVGANNVTFAAAVGTFGGTAGVLNKIGSGALTLNAAALHTGGTTLTAGTLNIGHAGAVGSGLFTIAAGVIDNTSGGPLTLAGNPAQSWSGNFAFTGTNNLDLGTGAVGLTATRTVAVTAGTLTVGGVISGGFGLTKAGAGTLYLKGASTFGVDSAVTIQGGTVIVDAASGLGSDTNNILFSTAAGTLRFTDNATFGAAQYFRTSLVAATIEVDAGKLVEIAGGPTNGATNGINTNGGTGGAGASLTKTGAGTLRISGGNGFFDGDGGWIVTQGTLSIAGTSADVLGDTTPASVALRLNGGTVSYDTDTPTLVNTAVGTVLQASSTVVSNLAGAGPGITQRLNNLTVNAGGLTLNVQGGALVTSGVAGITAASVTLNGPVTFNITDPTGGGTTLLTLGAVTAATNSLTLTGNGDFAQTGAIAGTATTALTLASGYSGLAVLNQTNTYSGISQINGGVLSFSASDHLGDASTTNDVHLGGGTLQFTAAGTVSLTANRQINLDPFTNNTIEVVGATGVLQAAGGIVALGAANLVKSGLGTLEVTNPLNLAGGNLSVTAGLLRSGLAAAGVGALNIAGGATLNLYDAVTTTSALTGLTLAAGSSLGFDLNAPGVNDVINLTGAPLISSGVLLNFNNLGGLGVGTYDLLNISSGVLNAGNFALGAAPSGFNYSFTTINSDQTLRLTASTLNLIYWRGDVDGSWNTNNAGNTNWATDLAGTIDLAATPVATDTIVFSATSAVGTAITTTLDGDFTVDSLQFTFNPVGVLSVAVNQGATGTLTLNPVSANNGISVRDNGGNIAIGAPLVALANQTWEVVGTGLNSSLLVSGNVTYTGRVTKTGAGTLTLGGTNSGAGGVTLAGGLLDINGPAVLGTGTFIVESGTTFRNTTAGPITLSTNNLQTWNGSFTFGGGGFQNLNLGAGAVTLGNNITAIVVNTLTVGGGIDDGPSTFGLTINGGGSLVLNGANSYDGLTNLVAGTLTLAADNSNADGGVTMAAGTILNFGHESALGTGPFTINGGTIDNSSGAVLGLSTSNPQFWNANFTFTGTNQLNLGTGPVALGATVTVTTTANNLIVGGGITGAFGLTKAGPGTLTLAGLSNISANNYDGATTLDGGTLAITAFSRFSGGLVFGPTATSNIVSTLNVVRDATFEGPFISQTNTATANQINITFDRFLSIQNSNVVIGAAGAGTNHRLNVAGTGGFVVSGGADLTFRVGGSSTAVSSNTLDLTALAIFSVNLGSAGAFRLGSSDTGSAADTNLALLAATSTIKAGTIDVGGNTTRAGTSTLRLGTGVNTLHANAVDIGSRETGTTARRSSGALNFAHATNGSVVIRAFDGTSAAALNLINSGANTNTNLTADALFAGHAADVLVSTLSMAVRFPTSTTTSTSSTANLTFDAGQFTAATAVLSSRAGAAITTGNTTANASFGGGSVSFGSVTMSLNSGTSATSSGSAISTLTLNGDGVNNITSLSMGSVTLSGATAGGGSQATLVHGGTATTTIGGVSMASNAATIAVTTNTSALSTINVTGGSLTITNNIAMATTSVNSANTADGAINITGGTLTVGGNILFTNGVGTETNVVTLSGGTLDMTAGTIGGAGALITFNAESGTLLNLAQLNNGAGLTKSTAGTLILEGDNNYTGGTTISGGILQVGTGGATGTLGAGTIVNNATLTINRSNAVSLTDQINGSGQLVQAGAGTTTLDAANGYTGRTSITAGVLSISSEANLGADPGVSAADQLFINGGTLATSATFAIDDAHRGISVGAAGGTIQTAAATALTISSSNTVTLSSSLNKSGAGALTINGAVTGPGALQVSSGTLNGSGTIAAQVQVQNGATFSAGASSAGDDGNGVGAISVASSVWENGAKFVFDFARTNSDTVPSASTNWDLITITGAAGLNLAGSSYTLTIRSWTDFNGVYGPNSDNPFDPDESTESSFAPESPTTPVSYRWLWVDNTGAGTIQGISGDGILNQFMIDTSNLFQPPGTNPYSAPTMSGHFWVSASGNDLYINYSSVPEPGSMVLVSLAGLALAAHHRRRRRKNDEPNSTTTESCDTDSHVA